MAGDDDVRVVAVPRRRLDCGEDALAVEAPLQISVNGRPFVVTMRTPGDDEDLARGLLFSERVIRDPAVPVAVRSTACRSQATGRAVDVVVAAEAVHWPQGGRSLLANASCGLCGKERIEDLPEGFEAVRERAPIAAADAIALVAAMRSRQGAFDRCGGTHAIAAFDEAGAILHVREDVGRHNAVDKVIGALLRDGGLARAAAMAVSGRVSYEIVSKAATARIPLLVAVSAPSSLALSLAERVGMTVVGFCRDTRCTVYTHPQRIHGASPDVARTA